MYVLCVGIIISFHCSKENDENREDRECEVELCSVLYDIVLCVSIYYLFIVAMQAVVKT